MIWNKISQGGVQPTMPIAQQKSIILLNRLALIGIPMTTFMGVMLFFVYDVKPVGILLWSNAILFAITLGFNQYNYTRISRFLISILPAWLVLFGSLVSKMNGISYNTIFYLNPKVAILIACVFAFFLFVFDHHKSFLLGIASPLLAYYLFDPIHRYFDIYFEKMPLITNQYSSFMIATTVLLVIILTGILFVKNVNQAYEKKIQEQNKALTKINEDLAIQKQETQDSILYAKRIQNAMLPQEEEMKKEFSDLFVLFQPKDIVSGDFYYFAIKGNKKIIAAIDCTGHGVPGALMSMIGNDLLEQIIHDKEIHDANRILDELHKGIRKSLKQAENDNKDGMDISLLIIDKQAKTITFAGAKNPLVYVYDNEVVEVAADKYSIGGEQIEQERIFTPHHIPYPQKGRMVCYLFSDGYQDQFGGEKRQKFSRRRFRELLNSIAILPLNEQKQKLTDTFEHWRAQGKEQIIDDVLVIGIAIDTNS
ncbi:MAG: hypothetical protein EAZ55_01835 [Cytophagales bacterium]|nr:MAG: hypothetical protein EAZ55_01835 [Cytophagales bacterium]